MDTQFTCTAFRGENLLHHGSRLDVALAIKAVLDQGATETILAFDDVTGKQIDFDLRGSVVDIKARIEGAEPAEEGKRGAGRPKLGVVAREVTLLPRHWEWLADQPGGASVVLRKLVEDARRGEASAGIGKKQAQQAADRFMSVMLGNQPGYEEASRALYASKAEVFRALSEAWPVELRDHVRKLAVPAFETVAA